MTLYREGVCSNLQEYRHIGEVVWSNRHITFIVAKKSLIYTLFCSIYDICGGKKLVENVIWERGLAENVRIPLYGGRDQKLLKKPS